MTTACPHCQGELLTAEDVAAELGVSPVTVRARAARYDIGVRLGQRVRLFTRDDIGALIEDRRRRMKYQGA